MLRNRSRAVSGKQALMGDNQISRFSSYSYSKPLETSLFGSPKFKAFSPTKKTIDNHNSVISPTSVLDSNNKPFFSSQNPFIKLPNPNIIIAKTTPISPEIISGPKKPIGLALIEEKNDDSKPTKSVIFSAKLRIQIPPPDSAVDVGGNNNNNNNNNNDNNGSLMTVKEMEVCEEYTCVKRHGPNAKITHIFDNLEVKSLVDDYYSYGSSHTFSTADLRKKKKKMNNNNDFLSFCYTCKNDLQLTNDIYIYRGEKAFCSHECRNQEMLLDEEDEDSS